MHCIKLDSMSQLKHSPEFQIQQYEYFVYEYTSYQINVKELAGI